MRFRSSASGQSGGAALIELPSGRGDGGDAGIVDWFLAQGLRQGDGFEAGGWSVPGPIFERDAHAQGAEHVGTAPRMGSG